MVVVQSIDDDVANAVVGPTNDGPDSSPNRPSILYSLLSPEGEHVIDVLRLLHDSMDLSRHLPATNESSGTPDS